MSSRSKGMAREREYEKLLQSRGYITQRVKGSTMFNKNCDFFGLWDIIAFKPNDHWLLVQVKSRYDKAVLKELAKWRVENHPPCCRFIFAVWRKGLRHDRWREVPVAGYVGEDE